MNKANISNNNINKKKVAISIASTIITIDDAGIICITNATNIISTAISIITGTVDFIDIASTASAIYIAKVFDIADIHKIGKISAGND